MLNFENIRKLGNAARGRRRCLGVLSAGLAATLLPSFAHAGAYEDFFRAVKVDDASTIQSLLRRGLDPNLI